MTATHAPASLSTAAVRKFAAPIGVAVVIVVVFLFYDKIVPNGGTNLQTNVQRWLSVSALSEMVIYVIMALGLNIVVGYAGLLDLGYVAFWGLGTFTAGWLMSSTISYGYNFHLGGSALSQRIQHGIHVNFWVVLVVAALFCAVCGVLIGAPTLRLKSDYLALVTLGFGEIVPQFFTNGDNIFGHNLTNGTKSITPIDAIGTGPFGAIPGVPNDLGVEQGALPFKLLIYALIAAFCLFVSLRIRVGRLGRSWLAIREDELAASMMGVPLVKAKLSSYAVGALFGGLGGACYATFVGGALAESFTYAKSITVLIMVVLGGMGNVWGVMLGALVIAWINNTGLIQLGAEFNKAAGTNITFVNYDFLIFGVILVLMMLFRREGLLPETRTRMILAEPARTELESLGSDVEAGQADDLDVVDTGVAGGDKALAAASSSSQGQK